MSSPCTYVNMSGNVTPCPASLAESLQSFNFVCAQCYLEDDYEDDIKPAIKTALGVVGLSLIVAPFLLDYKALSPIITIGIVGALKFPSFLINYKLLWGVGLVSCGMGLYLGYNPGAPIPI